MPAVRSSPAIVLRSWAYGESDKIVSFLTRDFGKIRGIAKGAKRSRKRFLNVLEPFTLVQLRFHQRSNSPLAFVHACDWVYVFREITRTLGKIAHASYLVEITDELTRDGDESLSLFTHLLDGLRFLEGSETSTEFLTAFELTLLRLAGYQPTLEHCQRCGAAPGRERGNGRWGFSPRDGGVLCGNCCGLRKEAVPLSADALGVLAHFQRHGWAPGEAPPFSAPALRETREVLPLFIQYQISKKLKSAAFLNGSFQ
ncbi:MAG: DNA repair protein RecO [Deltaproteobacteria bacterium]|nr:DNA repair protein RecO [Deltaproteobacteria bacterium]